MRSVQLEKDLVKDKFRSCYKVWSAFTKMIKKQVAEQTKMVDTKYIGVFYRDK